MSDIAEVAQRLEELSDELDCPELLALSEDLGSAAEREIAARNRVLDPRRDQADREHHTLLEIARMLERAGIRWGRDEYEYRNDAIDAMRMSLRAYLPPLKPSYSVG